MQEDLKKNKYLSLLFSISIGIFTIAALIFIYKNIFHFSFNQELLKRKKVSFLISSYDDDKLVMSVLVNLYPTINKVGFFFINPLIRFNKNDKPLHLEGRNSEDKIRKNLEEITGVKIQYSINITKENFIRIVDLIDGLTIFTDPFTVRSGKIFQRQPGEYSMSGEDLYDYATVMDNAEPLEFIHRISRQESIFLTAYDKINSLSIPDPILKLIFTLTDTSLSLEEFVSLHHYLESMHIIFSVSEFPGEPTIFPRNENASTYAMDIKIDTVKTAYHQFESEINSDYFLDGEKSRIEVLNFTDVDGLAKKVKSILQDKRLKVLSSSNGWDIQLKKSIVLDRSGNTEYSYKTAEILEIPEIKHSIRKDIGMDTTLLLGDDIGEKYKN